METKVRISLKFGYNGQKRDLRLTDSVSPDRSSAEMSSEFSMFFRKCCFKDVYASRESLSVFFHVCVSRFWKRRNAFSNKRQQLAPSTSLPCVSDTFQQIERKPASHGLPSVLNSTADLRSLICVKDSNVAFHLALHRISNAQ